MKLYYSQGACSLVVRIVLNELGLSFEDEIVDLRAKKTASGKNFFQINPKGVVPTLELDNGHVLTENQAILQYIVDRVPNQELLSPIGEESRYHTLEWMNYISTELHKTLGMFFNPTINDDVKTNVLIPLAMTRLHFVNERLKEYPYLVGEQFSLADPYLFVVTRWAYFHKLNLSDFNQLHAFMDRISKRESVIQSLEQEKIG